STVRAVKRAPSAGRQDRVLGEPLFTLDESSHVSIALEVKVGVRRIWNFACDDAVAVQHGNFTATCLDDKVAPAHDLERGAASGQDLTKMMRSEGRIDSANTDSCRWEQPLHQHNRVSGAFAPVRHDGCDPNLVWHPSFFFEEHGLFARSQQCFDSAKRHSK